VGLAQVAALGGAAVKYANGLAWIVAIVAVAFVAAYWSQIRWYLKNKATVDQAIEVGDNLSTLGLHL
jgi:hypothetical protein